MAERDGAREAVLRQIVALRSRMDPSVLDRLRVAVNPEPCGRCIPYDRQAARDAVQRFLAGREDGGRFRERLIDALRRTRNDR